MVAPLLILIMTVYSLFQEPGAGIFIIQEAPKKGICANEMKMVVGKLRVCLAKKPILPLDQVEYSTDIKYDPVVKGHYLDVGITGYAMSTLNLTVGSLPDAQFALVVDGEVICIFKVDVELPSRSIRIGDDIDLRELKVLDAKLKVVNQ